MDIKIIIIGILFILCLYAFISRHKVNTQVAKRNAILKSEQHDLELATLTLQKEKDELFQMSNKLQGSIDAQQEELKRLKDTVAATSSAQRTLVNQAFESYCDTLDQAYEQVDNDYQDKIDNLKKAVNIEQEKLNSIAQTRAAAQQALLKEHEIKENKDAYRLIPSNSDLDDIQALERVKKSLHKPRILSMLIWQTYWQPLAKNKFPIILQEKTKCGIYKITDILTNACYIGQSVDIYKRWNDHCKCGLGIDTPPGNKLYKAMQEDGLENFTFELLEECSREDLDAKERYFIQLYQAKEFGFNGNEGNK